jgi:hypothetical protein
MSQPLTSDELTTLKNGAYGAVFLVSNADPGIFDMVRESFAASRVLARSSGVVRDALTSDGLPDLPRSIPELEARVLPSLSQSIQILKSKAPADAENFRSIVMEACDRAATADRGVQESEAAELAKIRSALGGN